MNSKCPCKNCKKRHTSCWDTCKAYIAFREEKQEMYKKKKAYEDSCRAGFRARGSGYISYSKLSHAFRRKGENERIEHSEEN